MSNPRVGKVMGAVGTSCAGWRGSACAVGSRHLCHGRWSYLIAGDLTCLLLHLRAHGVLSHLQSVLSHLLVVCANKIHLKPLFRCDTPLNTACGVVLGTPSRTTGFKRRIVSSKVPDTFLEHEDRPTTPRSLTLPPQRI